MSFKIAGHSIGPDQPPYIIAEMSANHNHDLNRALALMEEAKRAGVDAIKLQTYTADTMTIRCESEDFMVRGGLWDGYSLHDLYQWAHTPWEWHHALFAKGRELGIQVFSTPFDSSAVDFLESLSVPAYKIASFEVPDLPLIARVAATSKPIIMSTGMASLGEIEEAVTTARAHGCTQLCLLHCVSAYPASPGDFNLKTLLNLAQTFGVVVGLSDHSLSNVAAIAAVANGASVVEKHFTLRRTDGGPDSAFSLEPEEMGRLVRECRTSWEAMGSVTYDLGPSEEANFAFRRSIYVVEDVAAGQPFTERNLRSIRPGYGLPPRHLPELLGCKAAREIKRGTRMSWSLVAE